MPFLQYMSSKPDKATPKDFVLAKELLGINISSIPSCIMRDTTDAEGNPIRQFDIEAFLVLCWIGAMREDPSLTKESVSSMIEFTDADAVRKIVREIYYFWTSMSRDEYDKFMESVKVEVPGPTQEPAADPLVLKTS